MQSSCVLMEKKVLHQIHSSSKRWLCSSSVHTFSTEIYHLEVWNTFLAFESNSTSFRDFLWLVIRPCWLRSSCKRWRSSCTSGCIVPSFSSFTSNISSNKVMASSILMTKSNLQLVQFSKIQHKVQDRESMVDVKVPPKSIICASKIIAYIKCILMVRSRCLFKNILGFLKHSCCLLNVTQLH